MEATYKGHSGLQWSIIVTSGILIVFLLAMVGNSALAQSGSYVIQTKDQLRISFWEYPELNWKAKVDRAGAIDLPIIGTITAEGLTIDLLRKKIISQMSLYNKVVTQLSVDVVEYGGNLVYVTGQIRTPGKYSFEEIPNLWEILLEAGGPLENAALDNVLIVRSLEGGKTYTADITEALRDASLSQLPEIKAGDAIQIPAARGAGAAASPLIKQEVIYIFGAIARQGAHKYVRDANLLEVIGQAGGPTKSANLKKVRHLSVSHGTTTVVEVDLDSYLKESFPVPMPVGPGDTIIIPQKSPYGQLIIRQVITIAVGVAVSYWTIKLIRN